MERLIMHRQPDNLVKQQYPDLLYKLGNDSDGMQALSRHKMYLEKPILGSHFKQAAHIENAAAEMSTACAGAELVGHVLTTERSGSHQRYNKELTEVLAKAWQGVQFVMDMDEMRQVIHQHGHDYQYDIRARTNNVRLHQNYYSLTELCENPIKMRLRIKQASDLVGECITLLGKELKTEPVPDSAEAQYCLSELGPELMNRLNAVRSSLSVLDHELRNINKPASLHADAEIPETVIDVSTREQEISSGRVADLSAFRANKGK